MDRAALPELFRTPLAERMRPAGLDEVLGQERLIGDGRPLRRLIESDRLTSMILWGPPGSGKTTIARLFAGSSEAAFEPFSAVLQGVRDLREVVARAEKRRERPPGTRTLLFVDEIHRFNKAQQDALLPHVESGLLTLVGATTENPSFGVNGALLSRCAVHVLEPISEDALLALMNAALADAERGVGSLGLEVTEDALRRIAMASGGDARRCLGAIERIALHHRARPMGLPPLTIDEVSAALGEDSLLYDRSGDEHFGCISAFIKSMRGSNPDATLYWLARMVEGGEEPLYLARRMVIFASEDIGVADPRALQIALSCRDAVHFLGLPEGKWALAEAAIYLATAPKSGSAGAYFKAAAAVREHGALPVPKHLKAANTGLMKRLGYGADYQYPHAYEGNFVNQQYLPDELQGRTWYQPTGNGYEKLIGERLRIWAKWKAEDDDRLKPGQSGKKGK